MKMTGDRPVILCRYWPDQRGFYSASVFNSETKRLEQTNHLKDADHANQWINSMLNILWPNRDEIFEVIFESSTPPLP